MTVPSVHVERIMRELADIRRLIEESQYFDSKDFPGVKIMVASLRHRRELLIEELRRY